MYAALRLRVCGVMLLMLGASYGCVDRPAPSESEGGIMPASSQLRFVRRVPEKGPPEAFTLHPDSYVTPEVFIEQYSASLWELSKLDELRLVSSLKDRDGYVSEFYKQFHAGYPVENGQFTLTISASRRVESAIGNPVGRLDGIPTEVRVSEGSAVEQARLKAVAACSLREPLTFMKTPAARLMVSENHRRLVWHVPVGVAEPHWIEWTVEIDARTGEVLKQWGGVGVNGEMPGCSPAN